MGDNDLVPVPDPLALPEEPTPQDFGFPANPTLSDYNVWRNQERYLGAYVEADGRNSHAASLAGVSDRTPELWVSSDKFGFQKRLAGADAKVLETLRAEIIRRGRDGYDHPITYRGQVTGSYKAYSDNLLMFETKRRDPEYRDSYQPVIDLGAREALEAMTQAVVQFNNANIQVNINVESEDKPAASIIDMSQNPEDKPAAG